MGDFFLIQEPGMMSRTSYHADPHKLNTGGNMNHMFLDGIHDYFCGMIPKVFKYDKSFTRYHACCHNS